MEIVPGKRYKTRNGQDVRISKIIDGCTFGVLGKRYEDGMWVATTWTKSGRYCQGWESGYDLVECAQESHIPTRLLELTLEVFDDTCKCGECKPCQLAKTVREFMSTNCS